MVRNSIRIVSLVMVLGLAACEGWEVQRTTAFPYGNERTAGTGVAYVLAKMAPEKELQIMPVERKHDPAPVLEATPMVEKTPEPAPVTAEEPIKDMEPVFKDKMTK